MNSVNHEGKGSPKHYVCNKSKCDDFYHMSEKVDEGIVDCEAELVATLDEIDDLREMIKNQDEENYQETKATQLLKESM